MFALLAGFIPLIPRLIEVGIVTYEAFDKVKTLITEDRSMTPEEREQLEAMILERETVLNDTSRDVPTS